MGKVFIFIFNLLAGDSFESTASSIMSEKQKLCGFFEV